MRRVAAALLCLGVVSSPAAAQLSGNPAQAPADVYRMDTAHSQLLFSVLHLGLTDYYGRFDRISGSLTFDPSHPENSAVDISVDPSSVDTASAELNHELAGPNVFNADKFDTATFKSTSVQRTGPATGRMTGDLTLRGVTKPVELDVTFIGGELNPMGNGYALGFKASGTIKRSDFGITGMRWEPMVSDAVTLTIEAMFDQEKN
jgi:polyisoprenoid-binding protein YceI